MSISLTNPVIFSVSKSLQKENFVCNGETRSFREYLPYARFTLASYGSSCMLAVLNDFLASESLNCKIDSVEFLEDVIPIEISFHADFLDKDINLYIYPFRPEILISKSWTGIYITGDPSDELSNYSVFLFTEKFLMWLISKEYLYYELFISKMRGEMDELVSKRPTVKRSPLVTICL